MAKLCRVKFLRTNFTNVWWSGGGGMELSDPPFSQTSTGPKLGFADTISWQITQILTFF